MFTADEYAMLHIALKSYETIYIDTLTRSHTIDSKERKELYKKLNGVREKIDALLVIDEENIDKIKEMNERQHPKEPILHESDGLSDGLYVCPKCTNILISSTLVSGKCYNFCPTCGQAIKWNEEIIKNAKEAKETLRKSRIKKETQNESDNNRSS